MEKTINIPAGRMAGEDPVAAMKRKQREMQRKKLETGETLHISPGGGAMPAPGEATIAVGKGKLAAQWYELNPTLLEMEKVVMSRNFPQFKLDKLDDGRLCWLGTIEPKIYESKFGKRRQYFLMAVYDNNHPNQRMGSSVRVYPIDPDVNELIAETDIHPTHLLCDENNNLYLCTNNAEDQKVGTTTTTAAEVLGWATKWLIAFELVLTGDLPLAKFNEHGGI